MCVDNIKMDLSEVGCGVVGQIGVAQDRDKWRAPVNAVISVKEISPYLTGNTFRIQSFALFREIIGA
jgi:hypothetical protein